MSARTFRPGQSKPFPQFTCSTMPRLQFGIFITLVHGSSLPTHWLIQKLLQPIQKNMSTTVRGYCLPKTAKLRRANVSKVTGGILLLNKISNLRLLEGWRTYRAKDHSALLLIFSLHHWLGLETGFRATWIFSLAQKNCSYNK